MKIFINTTAYELSKKEYRKGITINHYLKNDILLIIKSNKNISTTTITKIEDGINEILFIKKYAQNPAITHNNNKLSMMDIDHHRKASRTVGSFHIKKEKKGLSITID